MSSSEWASETKTAPELRGGDVDAALEQVPEEGAVALGVARLRIREVADGAFAEQQRRHPPDPLHATERRRVPPRAGVHASSSTYTAGSRRRRSAGGPAAVASGFPESVPAW